MSRAPFQPPDEVVSASIAQPSRMRWTPTVAAMLLVVLGVAGCSGSQSGMPAIAKASAATPAVGTMPRNASAAVHVIAIKDFAFEPATLSISAGSKVTWTNRDEEPHLVVSADAQFHASPALDTDDSYAAVFAKPGTYTYFCSIHPHMVGKIIVK
jgi:plastocyanin